jgi:hypothetical protein
MKKPGVENLVLLPLSIGKTPKNRSAVNIAVSHFYPLFYISVAASQNSLLKCCDQSNLAATYYSGQSFEIAASLMQAL